MAPPWALMGHVGSGPNWSPWALMGRAPMDPLGPNEPGPGGPPGLQWARPYNATSWALMARAVMSPLGPNEPGTNEPPWATMRRAL